ncbi:MAG: DUF262 domain-containing protein [Bacteroidetes bacterium]|nr:DUF262 domain-containing protein [Bacteroidota bacterium]
MNHPSKLGTYGKNLCNMVFLHLSTFTMPDLSNIMADVKSGSLTLPAFQRGYVWQRWQVRNLFDSLYKRNPVGSLLIWKTITDDGTPIKLLLDGQQRITSIYGVIHGVAPPFFSGNDSAFKNLYFHAGQERFEFYQPIKMKDDLLWFDVTKIMKIGKEGEIVTFATEQLREHPKMKDLVFSHQIVNRLCRLAALVNTNFNIEEIADANKPMEAVVDIFNNLNSAGTRLSKGDLALAKISTNWPEVRDVMRDHIKELEKFDMQFSLDWLLRCVNALICGEAKFTNLDKTPRDSFENGLNETVKHIHSILNLLSGSLGLDHDRVLFAKFAIPVLVRHWGYNGKTMLDATERNLILYWYLRCGIDGRFSGNTESKLKQSLVLIDGKIAGIRSLVNEIGTVWGRPSLGPADFDFWSIGARTYPLLYWMTRMGEAQNLCDGTPLKKMALGKGSRLEVHHIFPKAVLKEYKNGTYSTALINAIGNYCFLTSDCNKQIDAAAPAERSRHFRGNHPFKDGYFYWVAEHHPGALKSQWIPMDEELWKVKNYRDFLVARRQILADAANDMLRSLNPEHPVSYTSPSKFDHQQVVHLPQSHVSNIDELQQLEDIQRWMDSQKIHRGEFGHELASFTDSLNPPIIDLAWPNGIPEGVGRPVALLLNESMDTIQLVTQAGYDCFTNIDSFKRFVEKKLHGPYEIGI